ncbi:MAG: MFS transporter [Puniceicoccaceae bacterium]
MQEAGSAGKGNGGRKGPSLSPYSNLLKFSFFNATTWMIAMGTPLVLLASELGASSFEVGLIYSFVFLLLPVQIIATSTLPKLGYKKQIMLAWIARGASLIIPFLLALQAPDTAPRWMVHALILSAFLFAFFRTFGSCALPPLLYATMPDSVRGRYFSTDQAVAATAGILTLLLLAVLFRMVPAFTAFAWQYAYALFAVIMTLFYMARVKDPPKPVQTSLREIALETPKISLQPSPFRQYLVFMIASALMGTAFVPLKAYYLKVEAGIGTDQILLYTAIQYFGAIMGTMLLRKHIDGLGVKPIFRISLFLGAVVSIYWLLLVRGTVPGMEKLLMVAYFLFGISASQWLTAHLKYMPRVCSEKRQALHVSVHAAIVGIVGGIAPIVWGYLVKTPGTPGVDREVFAIFFIAMLFVQVLLFLYIPHLTSQHRDRPPLQTGSGLLRPFRYLGGLINIIPEKRR